MPHWSTFQLLIVAKRLILSEIVPTSANVLASDVDSANKSLSTSVLTMWITLFALIMFSLRSSSMPNVINCLNFKPDNLC